MGNKMNKAEVSETDSLFCGPSRFEIKNEIEARLNEIGDHGAMNDYFYELRDDGCRTYLVWTESWQLGGEGVNALIKVLGPDSLFVIAPDYYRSPGKEPLLTAVFSLPELLPQCPKIAFVPKTRKGQGSGALDQPARFDDREAASSASAKNQRNDQWDTPVERPVTEPVENQRSKTSEKHGQAPPGWSLSEEWQTSEKGFRYDLYKENPRNGSFLIKNSLTGKQSSMTKMEGWKLQSRVRFPTLIVPPKPPEAPEEPKDDWEDGIGESPAKEDKA